MAKEMVISTSPQETKIAVLEDGLLVEVYFEREREYTLAGSIYKGRVTRILPGMQSAFVNIGLERDAFLYVSDFLEGIEEYDRILTTAEERGTPVPARAPEAEERPEPASPVMPSAPEIPERSVENAPDAAREAAAAGPQAAGSEQRSETRDRAQRFSRRRRGRGGQRGFPESKYARRGPPPPPQREPSPAAEPRAPQNAPILLPGESLAKYKDRTSPSSSGPAAEAESAGSDPAASQNIEEPGQSAVFTGSAAVMPIVEAAREEEQARIEELRKIEPVPEAPAQEAIGNISEAVTAPSGEPRTAPEDDLLEQLEAEALEADEAQDAEEAEEQFAQEMGSAAAPFSESALASPEEDFLAERSADVEQTPSEPSNPSVSANAEAPEASADEPPQGSPDPPSGPDGGEEPRPQTEAVVRERGGNPRYLRKQRFQRRGPGRPDDQRRRGRPFERQPSAKPLIGDMLKEGQEIIVQVAKEPLGKKGARITSHIALPGRYLVYMPTLEHVGVSRKIASDEERQRLKRIILTHSKNSSGGFIVRTAGVGRSEEDFRQDIAFLVKLWNEIKARAEKVSAPALLHHDLDLVLRTLRDQLSEEFDAIWVDNEHAYEQIVSLVQKFQPLLVNRVRLYTKDAPLFEETGVQEEINRALKPKVWLKSGGYIVINQTEALVAIDVNTGKFVGKSNRLEDTIVKTNVEAIQEIVRQIRLRDLGGIIVIDFIDMDERKNRQKVMSALEDSLRHDRAPSKILAFNEFGLVAITRKRVRQSLERTLCQPCVYCGGSGMVKSPSSISLEILAEARKIAPDLADKQVTLRVNPEVAKTLKTRENGVMSALEEITSKGVIVRSDPAVHMENFYFD